MTLHASAIDDLLLLALLPQKKEPEPLRRIAAQAAFARLLNTTGRALHSETTAAARRLVERGLVSTATKAPERVLLSAEGRKAAAEYLGHKTLAPTLHWGQKPTKGQAGSSISIYYGYLPAKVLGIAGSVDRAGLKRLATVDGLRAEILRQRFQLDLPPVPTIEVVRAALAWKLLEDGADAALIQSARGRAKAFNSAELVADILMFSRAQCTRVKQGSGHVALANVLMGLDATKGTADALYLALLRPSLEAEVPVKPGPRMRRPGTKDASKRTREPRPSDPERRPDDFAERTLRAARGAETGRIGENLVFISHVWRSLHGSGESISLSEFKRRLVEAYDRDQIRLARAEMPQTLNARDLEESQTVDRNVTFAFVRL